MSEYLVSWLQFEPGTSGYEELVPNTELRFYMLKGSNLRFTKMRVFIEMARIGKGAVLDIFDEPSRHLFAKIMEEQTNIRQLRRYRAEICKRFLPHMVTAVAQWLTL